MTEVLPKKRSKDGSRKRHASNVQNLANMGRVISGRVPSKTKRIISNRGDLFDDASNTSFGEDAINFDLNKNTIMSNFEEWIKLSTDNKITSKNSWQFALIDYFHDLNVIKDGDDINFQRASATLDGCVKIYSSRVESVASETGKLLSGLANKKGEEADDLENEEQDDDQDLNENGEPKKARKLNRILESTLVSFDAIRVKKLEQELSIDPLFKKALAEFDEGGAKSLLLNTLNIDNTGRVVFDATTTGGKIDEAQESSDDLNRMSDSMNLGNIQSMLFKDDGLENLSLCPSMDQLKVVLSDIDQAKSVLTDVNNKFNDQQTLDDKSISKIEDANGFDFGDYDDNNFNDDFGNDNGNDIEEENEDDNERIKEADQEEYELGPGNRIMDQDLMAYFDETMKSNWRGPEHWKVSAYKKSKSISDAVNNTVPKDLEGSNTSIPKKKNKKEPILINFFEEDDIDDDVLFTKPNQASAIQKKSGLNETELPEDIQYNSTRLVSLFLKPETSILYYPKVKKTGQGSSDEAQNTFTDENFFAEQYNQQDRMASFHQAQFEEINQDYEDDGDVFGGIDFNDALEEGDGVNEENKLVIGGRKVRPEYVNFSRIAKRVDVKLLKDNLWKGIKQEKSPSPAPDKEATPEPENPVIQFGNLVENIGKMYSPEEKKDLSTSFCFICLLHLANEHGLTVTGTPSHDDLQIAGF